MMQWPDCECQTVVCVYERERAPCVYCCVVQLRLLELVSVLSGHFDIFIPFCLLEITLLPAKTSPESRPLTETDPHPFVTVSWGGGGICKCQAEIPAEQMSRWPSGFCLLCVEVLFCCMRHSAASSGCSEPGWERWKEGTVGARKLPPPTPPPYSDYILCPEITTRSSVDPFGTTSQIPFAFILTCIRLHLSPGCR